MIVNGEHVYTPRCRVELIEGLNRMGVSKVEGISLQRVKKDLLVKEYYRVRSATLRRQQRERRQSRIEQLPLF